MMTRRSQRRVIMAKIEETDLPGVGKKYTVTETESGDRFAVIVHIGGRREVYRFAKGSDEPDAVFEFDDDEAKKIGAILGGAYFTPPVREKLEFALRGLVLEWLDVKPSSTLAGKSLKDAALRTETGVTVIAILREGETHPNPPPEFTLRASDTIVAAGTMEQMSLLRRLTVGDGTT